VRRSSAIYHNDQLDKPLAEANAVLDSAKQAPLIRQVMAIEQNDRPMVTLWQCVGRHEERDRGHPRQAWPRGRLSASRA
jgi:ABC-type transport system substrate-binding protein